MRILCALLLLSFHTTSGAEANASWGIGQLMQGLAQVTEAKGRFVESKTLSMLNRPLDSSGVLQFQAPGHLEKHTLMPKEESLVLDQGVLTIDSKARHVKRTLVLQEYPAIWAFVESIRSTLAGDLPTLERFYKVELQGDTKHWKLRLLPLELRARQMIREIVISGRENHLESIETKESNGDYSKMQIVEAPL